MELIHLNDLNGDVTLLFSTNQRPRNLLTRHTTENQLTGRPCFTSRRLQKIHSNDEKLRKLDPQQKQGVLHKKKCNFSKERFFAPLKSDRIELGPNK